MRRIILFSVFLSLAVAGFSQDEPIQKDDEMITLLSKNRSIGGYGSLSMAYSNIFDRDAFVFSARGTTVLNHIFALGLGGSGFVTDFNRLSDNTRRGYAGGYGGIVMEPIILPRFPVHISIPVLVGAGGIALTSYEVDADEANVDESDAFLIVEPGVELELNVTKFFRFAFGGYYRFTSNMDIIETNSFDGFSFGVSLKFGKF